LNNTYELNDIVLSLSSIEDKYLKYSK
jgi:hypothetical protein